MTADYLYESGCVAGLRRESSKGIRCSSLYIFTAKPWCSMKCGPTSDVLRYVILAANDPNPVWKPGHNCLLKAADNNILEDHLLLS